MNTRIFPLTHRERFLRTVLHQPVDRGVFFFDYFWTQTLTRWRKEGMPDTFDFGFDISYHKHISGALSFNTDFDPPFPIEVLQDEGRTQIIRDPYGVIKRVFRDLPSQYQQFLERPVKDRITWEVLKPRLDPDTTGRFPTDWDTRCAQLKRQEYPIMVGGSHLTGFFGFIRELTGDLVYYLFRDDPDLIRDMVEFQVHRLTRFIDRISLQVPLDGIFFWEDMCYKAGPLVGPRTFREFFFDAYARTIDFARSRGLRIFYLDSDGNVDLLLPLWIDAGINLVKPFEVAAGMDVVQVARRYGDRLAMIGGIDKRQLARDRKAIDQELERIRPAFEMGGYMPCVDHSVPPDVSWDNFQYYHEKRRVLCTRGS